MKIGLYGYGKMGKTIEKIAQNQGHTIAWRLQKEDQPTPELLRQADVAIEFTQPESGYQNVLKCLEAGIPVVSGTTGWQAQLPAAEAFCLQNGGAMLWASNFSVGVNLFFALNQRLAQLMAPHTAYTAQLEETHHIHKLDAPSGTALTLAEGLLQASERYTHWALAPQKVDATALPITAYREGEVPGTHRITWQSEVDEISIEHKAHSRAGFAVGAVLAAEWIVGKEGVFGMGDVLGV